MLETRKRALEAQIQSRIRDFRESDSESVQGPLGEVTDHPSKDDVEFALVQMQSIALDKISAVLKQLDDGDYGTCHDCGEDIPEMRLRAMPFATRCRECQESAERLERRQVRRDVPFRVRAAGDTIG